MPIAYIKSVMELLTLHYRLRLARLYITNAGRGFAMAWRAIKGMLPESTLEKTRVFGVLDAAALAEMDDEVGLEYIDEQFGGAKKVNLTEWNNTDGYFSTGYWSRRGGSGNGVAQQLQREVLSEAEVNIDSTSPSQ